MIIIKCQKDALYHVTNPALSILVYYGSSMVISQSSYSLSIRGARTFTMSCLLIVLCTNYS